MESGFEIRLHGRGGQGVVTAAEVLSVAAFLDGHEAQAFPTFGSERMGAPVTSFCRIARRPIRTHEPVAEPQAVIVSDATLLHQVDVFGGLRNGGYVLINSVHSPEHLGISDLVDRLGAAHVRCIPATDLALEHIGRPLPNICLLGALTTLTGQVTRESLERAVQERFPAAVADANVAALRAASELVKEAIDA
jgi:pyruvate ferredoxin oxidoreductase gamma subunit